MLLALAPLIALSAGLVVFCLVDIVRSPSVRIMPKPVWALAVFVSIPLGAIAYLVLGRERNAEIRAASADGPIVAPQPRPIVPGSPAVVTHGLTHDYGNGAGVFGIDLQVPAGSVYGLVGPNGAGKTTLLSMLTGLRRADAGSIEIPCERSAIGVCPDVGEFEPWLTAFEVVDLARAMVDPSLDVSAVHAALRTTGLTEVASRRVGGFSRGMTQRLSLAAGLVGNPQLLIMDEPTSALDPSGRAEVLELVRSMRGQRTVVFSSHILADVQHVADVIGILRNGRLLYQGSTQALVDTRLTPRWSVRLAVASDEAVRLLRESEWATRVVPTGPDTLEVEARTLDEGALGLPRTLAAAGARLVSCEPLAADLEAAFFALTEEGTP